MPTFVSSARARADLTLHTPPLIRAASDVFMMTRDIERRGIVPNAITLFSAHQMSRCRIGASRDSSVADPDGQVWGVRGLYVTDASAFPSACGVNPMLTVMALARRTAQGIVAAS